MIELSYETESFGNPYIPQVLILIGSPKHLLKENCSFDQEISSSTILSIHYYNKAFLYGPVNGAL